MAAHPQPGRDEAARRLPGRVVVINDDARESGGAAGIALASIRVLRARGIPVTLLNGSDEPTDLAGAGDIEIVSLGGKTLLGQARGSAAIRGLFDPGMMRAVQRWIARNDDPGTVYHLHNWHKVLSPSVFVALRRVADRLCMTAHDYFLACPNGGQFLYPQGKGCDLGGMSLPCIRTQCDRRHYAHKLWRVARGAVRLRAIDLGNTPATVVVVHEGMSPHLVAGGIGQSAIRVIRNPVSPWRSERVTAECNRDVFFVGRLEADKGVDLVAASACAAGLRLRVIGDGPLRADLARDYPEADLLGWRPRAEIADLIRSARLVVVPTRWRETFGLVAFEAIGSGVPVIISEHALVAGDIVRIGAGEACDPYDGPALTAILARAMKDDARVRAMSEAGFGRWRELAPDLDGWADALLDLYAAKLAASPHREEATSRTM